MTKNPKSTKALCIELGMLLVFLLLFTETSAGYYDGCDHIIHVKYGETAEIQSFNYPDSYSSEQNCRWTVDSPPHTRIFLQCPELHQPEEDHCLHIAVDRTVEPNPIDVKFFCRANPFSVHSLRNSMTITINNNRHSLPGEAFKCFLTVDYADCDRTIKLEQGQKGIPLKSPNYPVKDPAGTSCRWKVASPHGTRIFLSCPNAEQPKEEPCGGWFDVAPNGNMNLESNSAYCRDEGFTKTSRNNRMVIAYNTSPDSQPGWSFTCYLTVEPVINPEQGWGDKECNCGRKNTARILGGEDAGVHEFPMMAIIAWINNSSHICGATIISERWALTAAHCVSERLYWEIGLQVGEHDRSKAEETASTAIIQIDQITVHRDWNLKLFENDIALVRVNESITFDQNIGPACLPFSNRDQSFAAEDVFSLGWGRTTRYGTKSNILQKAKMIVMDKAQCKGWNSDLDFAEKLFCTFTMLKDFCFGDSGGPLLWFDPVSHQLKLIGIHSAGTCNEYKIGNLITRVPYYVDWIEDHTEGTKFCKK